MVTQFGNLKVVRGLHYYVDRIVGDWSRMGFSQKTVYALRAMHELAGRQGQGPVGIALFAEVRNIPPQYTRSSQLENSG